MTSSDKKPAKVSQVGPYRVLSTLGTGSMATVSLAEQSGPGGFRKKVALKVIQPKYAEEETFIKLLMREAAIGGMLRHPNIIQTLSFEQYDGNYVLVLEYVEGMTLDRLLAEHGALDPAMALDVAIQICKGLTYAHQLVDDQGGPMCVIHRDLKPANLMRSQHGVIKIMDFGIARATASWAALTAQGIIRGTPSYMSPEQVLDNELDGRSDLFAVGAILYEMLTGVVLFKGTNMLDVLEKVAKVEINDAFVRVEQALPGAAALLQKLLTANPMDRYQDATSVAAALTEMLQSISTGGSGLGSLDDLSQAGDMHTLIAMAGGTAKKRVRKASGEATSGRGKKRRKRKQRGEGGAAKARGRKREVPSNSLASDNKEIEEFIYVEESEEEEFFVFEEVDELAEALEEREAADKSERDARASTRQASSPAMPAWSNALEQDFFDTGPIAVEPGSMGPVDDEEPTQIDVGPREDDLFDDDDDSRPPTDAVAKDVLEALVPGTGSATAVTLDELAEPFAEDDELWTEGQSPSASPELATQLETVPQHDSEEDDLSDTEQSLVTPDVAAVQDPAEPLASEPDEKAAMDEKEQVAAEK